MTNEQLDKLEANLKKSLGLVTDVMNAANKLPQIDAADDFYTAVEESHDAIDYALERLRILRGEVSE